MHSKALCFPIRILAATVAVSLAVCEILASKNGVTLKTGLLFKIVENGSVRSAVVNTVCLKKPDRYNQYDITSPIHNVHKLFLAER